MRRGCHSALVALGLVACGGGAEGARHTLSDGTVVEVGDDGAVTVTRAGHPLLALASRGPEAATFSLVHSELFGMWQFHRDGEGRRHFDEYLATTRDGDRVTLRYAAEDASEARLSIALGEDDTLAVSLEADGPHDALSLPLRCDDASFHGWGAQYGATDQRGEAFDLFVEEQGIGRTASPEQLSPAGHAHTTYYPMPYFVDRRGFGMLVTTERRVLVDLCRSDPAVATIESETPEAFEAVIFPGPTPAEVIRQLGAHVGRPKKPPRWAWELWIGAQGGRDAVLAEADALDAAEIPVGAFWVQDWTGQRTNLGGGSGVEYRWVADETFYPDLKGLIDTLHQRGQRFLGYVNPFVMPDLDHFDEMAAEGWLITHDGSPYLHSSPAGDASHPDLTNPAARDYVKSYLAAAVTDLGMDGWMADFGEWLPLDATLHDGSDPLAHHNRYPEAWHRLSREVMDAVRPDGDWAVFSRSGFTGQQSVAQIVWCGDQEATFDPGDGLPTVVPCMINLGLSGVPFVTHDIAGFSGGPSTKELYLRWIELGAFTPVMRTHEGNLKDENWSWERDQETTAHLRRFARIHLALGEELEALAEEAAQTSLPMVRHLMIAFPDDPTAATISDQYLLGDLLVAPVTEEGATSRSVYLPAGVWYHVFSGERHEGPVTLTIDAPIGSPPVFSRGADRSDLRAIE